MGKILADPGLIQLAIAAYYHLDKLTNHSCLDRRFRLSTSSLVGSFPGVLAAKTITPLGASVCSVAQHRGHGGMECLPYLDAG
jgi:hypothetical protein